MTSSSSFSRSGCYVCSNENPLIPKMLSELAFHREHDAVIDPPTTATKTSKNGDNHRLTREATATSTSTLSSFLSSWSGLFCFSFEDQDMFYDAEELHLEYDKNGKHILTKEEQELLKSLRGGHRGNADLRQRAMASLSTSHHSHQKQQQQLSPSSHASSQGVPGRQETLGSSSSLSSTKSSNNNNNKLSKQESTSSFYSSTGTSFGGIRAPQAPEELPLRFLRAGKGDPVEGRRRYEATLKWRKEHGIDSILLDAHPNFELIKKHYPHYYHLRGHKGEPVFFEQPPKTNLAALKAGGIDLPGLVHHYTMITEFQWQFIERDDLARSITVLDLEGMRMRDFVGECVEYVKMCSQFTGQHYPERAGHVIVVNVPRWFSMIWNVVKPMVDEVTLQKISIVRGANEVFEALAAKIPVENIPPEYGGKSVPLGQSPEENDLRALMAHNNALARGDYSCGGRSANPPCRFCTWGPARSY
mmetsp:Transcript_14913/g.24093  ORF Transcript_14913/g.24093 Transcript_14913/m.24093 type:complete len:474 (+) Transcript_14913:526-1947(+)